MCLRVNFDANFSLSELTRHIFDDYVNSASFAICAVTDFYRFVYEASVGLCAGKCAVLVLFHLIG